MNIKKAPEGILFRPGWFLEHLGLKYKVLPLKIVDDNSQSASQAYSIGLFVNSMDNKVIPHPAFLSTYNIECMF